MAKFLIEIYFELKITAPTNHGHSQVSTNWDPVKNWREKKNIIK